MPHPSEPIGYVVLFREGGAQGTWRPLRGNPLVADRGVAEQLMVHTARNDAGPAKREYGLAPVYAPDAHPITPVLLDWVMDHETTVFTWRSERKATVSLRKGGPRDAQGRVPAPLHAEGRTVLGALRALYRKWQADPECQQRPTPVQLARIDRTREL